MVLSTPLFLRLNFMTSWTHAFRSNFLVVKQIPEILQCMMDSENDTLKSQWEGINSIGVFQDNYIPLLRTHSNSEVSETSKLAPRPQQLEMKSKAPMK